MVPNDAQGNEASAPFSCRIGGHPASPQPTAAYDLRW